MNALSADATGKGSRRVSAQMTLAMIARRRFDLSLLRLSRANYEFLARPAAIAARSYMLTAI